MDFVYAPPPPPPSSKKPDVDSNANQKNKPRQNNNKKNNRNNNRKNKQNHKNQNNQHQQTIKQDIDTTSNDQYQPDNQVLFDLPTHLPNEIISESVKVDDSIVQESNNPSNEGINHTNGSDNEEVDVEVKPKDPSQPVFIPGTSITLQTEEDIAKWIEERKKKWPTRSNVLKKQEEKELSKQQDKQQDEPNSRKRRNSIDPTTEKSPKKSQNICRFYQQHKHCKFGNKCKNIHESPSTNLANNSRVINPIVNMTDIESTHYKRTINDVPVIIPKLYSNNQKSGGRLFKHLVKREHSQHENNVILDFVQYLDDKGLIDHDVMKSK